MFTVHFSNLQTNTNLDCMIELYLRFGLNLLRVFFLFVDFTNLFYNNNSMSMNRRCGDGRSQ